MKILFVAPHYFPLIGGVESYVQTLAEGLKNDHEIIVVTSGHRREQETIHGVKVYRLPVSMILSNTPIGFSWYWQLRKIIKQEQPDVINAHSPVPFMADVALAAARDIPFVLTYHSGSMVKGVGGLVDGLLKAYERFALPRLIKKSRRVVAIDPDFIQARTSDTDKVKFIPPGIDTEVFVPNRAIEQLFDVTFVGRIQHTSAWKGVDVLLQAIAKAKQQKSDLKAQIVGEGDAVEYYRNMAAELDISDQVTFSGPLKGRELVGAYQRSRIVVLPSKTESESFGMVLAEAMACGVPVIGSKIGGIPRVIAHEKTGLLVSPNDPAALAKSIRALLGDETTRRKYGEAGVQRVNKLFSRQRLIQETEALLKAASQPRIVHVTANYPPRLGGLENVVKEMAVGQYEDGKDVRVITSRLGYRDDYKDEVKVQRLRAIEIAHTPLMPGLLWQLLKIKKRDMVHIHVAQAYVPEMVWLASLFKRFNYVAHIHLDVAPSGPAGVILGLYKALILKFVLRRARYVIVFTKDQKQLMQRRYGLADRRVVVVPNGVSERFYQYEPRTLHHPPRLLFVGRLSLQKNLPLFLNSLKGISHKFETRIVGDGDLRTEHEALARELGLKNVHFYGRQDGEALLAQYKKADVFVLPSEREGMPLVLLEAMAMALPIVGTDVTGIKDVVDSGKTGQLVALDDQKAFAAALEAVTANPKDYQKMSQAALKKAEDYSWVKVRERFYELYGFA